MNDKLNEHTSSLLPKLLKRKNDNDDDKDYPKKRKKISDKNYENIVIDIKNNTEKILDKDIVITEITNKEKTKWQFVIDDKAYDIPELDKYYPFKNYNCYFWVNKLGELFIYTKKDTTATINRAFSKSIGNKHNNLSSLENINDSIKVDDFYRLFNGNKIAIEDQNKYINIAIKKEDKKEIVENLNTDTDIHGILYNTELLLFYEFTKYWTYEESEKFEDMCDNPRYVEVVDIKENKEELDMIKKRLLLEIKCFDLEIIKVQRLQNGKFVRRYAEKYLDMIKLFPEKSKKTLNKEDKTFEKRSYCGMAAFNVKDILFNNIDPRAITASNPPKGNNNGQQAQANTSASNIFGDGVYLSEHLLTSYLKTNMKRVYMVRALPGVQLKGKPGIRRGPYIPKTVEIADSVFGNIGDDNVDIIFNKYQILPEYLIEFAINEEKINLFRASENHKDESKDETMLDYNTNLIQPNSQE